MIVAAFMAAAVIPFSCSNDELVDNSRQQSDAFIIFNPLINHAVPSAATRSVTATTSANISDADREFDMWAFATDATNTYHMGHNANIGYRITTDGIKDKLLGWSTNDNPSNIVVSQAEAAHITLWGYKGELILWPLNAAPMQFYAISPAISAPDLLVHNMADTYAPNLEPNITYAAPTFRYKSEETFVGDLTATPYNYNSTHGKMRDIMVAGRKTELQEVNKTSIAHPVFMNVALTFRHALSQFVFEGKVAENYPGLEITVHSITLCNLLRQGTCTISSDGTPSWSFTNEDKADRDANRYSYTIMTPGANGEGTLISTDNGNAETAVPFSNGSETYNSDNLMLIPQTLDSWRPTIIAEPESASQKGVYLKIRCTAKQNGQNLLTEDFVYVPFGMYAEGMSWNGVMEAGRKYSICLIFGLGRNSHGYSNGQDITFSVSVGDSWGDSTSSETTL